MVTASYCPSVFNGDEHHKVDAGTKRSAAPSQALQRALGVSVRDHLVKAAHANCNRAMDQRTVKTSCGEVEDDWWG